MPAKTARTVERLRQRLAVVQAIGRAIARPFDPVQVLRALHRELSSVLDTTILILGLYDEPSQTVEVVGQIIAGKELPGGSFPLGSGFTSQAIRTGRAQLIRRWSQNGPRVQVQYATDQPGLPESALTVPLDVNGRVIGVLLVQSYQPEAYDEDDLLLIEAIAGQVAAAVEAMRQSEYLVTQRQRRVSELEAVLAGISDALLIVDDAGRIVRLNNAARNFFSAQNVSVVLGQPLDQEQWGQWPLGARELAEALKPIIAALRRGEALADHEIEFRAGERRVLSFSCSPLREPGSGLAGGAIVFRDVTERRAVERLKDEILSIASHDLRTPLTVVKGHAQILQRQIAGGRANADTIAKGLSMIVQQTDRVIELLALLLDLSRLEAGRLELRRDRTDLAALTRSVIEGIRTTTDRHRLVLRAPSRLIGNWDERRLERVLHNLLANAVKYSPSGGTIEVKIEASAEGVTVCVRDEGTGLAPDQLAQIFERFYQAESTQRLEGAGLGLYICQGIIAAHGGRIWAESDGLGLGSRFYFSLPRTAKTRSSTAKQVQ